MASALWTTKISALRFFARVDFPSRSVSWCVVTCRVSAISHSRAKRIARHFRSRVAVLYAENHAVGGFYVTGWTCRPEIASATRATVPRKRVLTFEANYHPDGGQVFFPKHGAYVALLAKPSDEVKPEDFVAFLCTGEVGIHIDANVWHQPVYPLADRAEFADKQGAVHACVSVDFAKEFGCLLSFPLALQ